MGSLCQINRVERVLDQKTLIIVINALVFSRMYYCSCVWANTSKKNIAKLQNVQNLLLLLLLLYYYYNSRFVSQPFFS